MSPQPAEHSRLGPYELLVRIGKGGMGEVWRAHDPRLNRDVAIKFSAERFSDRFEREARAIAALSHPNICTLFDIGPNYLVMELIEGPTLAERLAEGPIALEEAVSIARQIAEALEAAHEKNIVHRDLKPGNLKVPHDGPVKVLDFGLAKSTWADAEESADPATLTMRNSPTHAGAILGTAAYMAPEQARGKTVDKRADIWSFGVVLCEMVTGKRVFEGEDLTETLASVVKSDPDLTPVPAKVRRLISKCLQKDPKKRLRDLGDAWELLDDTERSTAPAQPGPSRTRWLWPAIAGVSAAALAVVSMLHFREKPASSPPPIRFQVPLPKQARFEVGGAVTLSPDGRHVAFPAFDADGAPHYFVEDLASGAARELSNTAIGGATPPAWWSPDSAYLMYSGMTTIDKVEVATGMVQTVCPKPGPAVGGAWNRDGTVIFGGTNSGLWRVPAGGGKPVALTRLDASRSEVTHQIPRFLPDQQHYIFLATASDQGASGIFARSLEDPIEKPSRLIVNSDYSAQFVPGADGRNGWLLYLHGGLVARAFDTDKLVLTGAEIGVPATIGRAYRTALFSASPEMLVYRAGESKRVTQLEWVDMKSGKSVGVAGESGLIIDPVLSPDEKYVAYAKLDESGTSDIWILDLHRGTSRRLTPGEVRHEYPRWSPDGSEVVYSELVNGTWRMTKMRVDGTGGAEAVLSEPGISLGPESWSPDGRFLLFTRARNPGFVKTSLGVLPLTAGGNATAFSGAQGFSEAKGAFSPDGHYVAYISDETGRSEVYVRTFGPDSGGRPAGKWIVSRSGGIAPQWTRDGRRLLWSQNGFAWGAPVDLTHGFQAGLPERLYPIPQAVNAAALSTTNGLGLVLNPVSQILDEPLEVLVNWMPAAGAK